MATEQEALPLTLQFKLRRALLEDIGSGKLAAGDRMPSERELCELHGVSRITVREVMGALEKDGHLVRKQGRGTFVAVSKHEQMLEGFYSFGEEIRKMGLEHSAQVLECELEANRPEAVVAASLPMPLGGYRISRLRMINGEVFAYEMSYVSMFAAMGLTRELIEQHGLYGAIRKQGGTVPDRAEESFEAMSCPAAIAKQLGVKSGCAVLHVIRTAWSGKMAVEYCDSYIIGDKFKYKVTLG